MNHHIPVANVSLEPCISFDPLSHSEGWPLCLHTSRPRQCASVKTAGFLPHFSYSPPSGLSSLSKVQLESLKAFEAITALPWCLSQALMACVRGFCVSVRVSFPLQHAMLWVSGIICHSEHPASLSIPFHPHVSQEQQGLCLLSSPLA